MPGARPVEATQQVVENQPGPESHRCPAPLGRPGRGVGEADVLVDRNHELEGLEQVVGDPGQDLLLPEALGHQLELELGQVPDPAVEQLGRPARGPGGEIVLLDQRHPEAPGRQIEGRSAAGDSAADHQDVEAASVGQQPEMFGPGPAAGGRGHGLRLEAAGFGHPWR